MRGTRTVRRLLGVGAALALVGPLSSVARPDVAAAMAALETPKNLAIAVRLSPRLT